MNNTSDYRLKAINTCLGKIGNKHGIDLSLDNNNTCIIKLNDNCDMALEVLDNKDSIVLLAYVGQEKVIDDVEYLKEILSWNYDLPALESCTLGLCSASDRFTLKTYIDIDHLDEIALENIIIHFGETLNTIIEELKLLESKTLHQPEANNKQFTVRSQALFDLNKKLV